MKPDNIQNMKMVTNTSSPSLNKILEAINKCNEVVVDVPQQVGGISADIHLIKDYLKKYRIDMVTQKRE